MSQGCTFWRVDPYPGATYNRIGLLFGGVSAGFRKT